MIFYKNCCPSPITEAHTDRCLSRQAEMAEREAEIKRLREQVQIAEDVLTHIARCGRAACGPAPRELAHARTLADDALTRMDAVE